MQISPAQYPSASNAGFIPSGEGLRQEHLAQDSGVTAGAVDWQSSTMLFEGNYVGEMKMSADAKTVADYLDAHSEWFARCAKPIAVEAIGDNGYALILGRFSNLNFSLEPKIGLHLLPQDAGVYRIETIPVPDYEPEGYSVDFQAAMTLNEMAHDTQPDQAMTNVEWELKLLTSVQMPRFIQALPYGFVKASGDKLLNQIVKQISRRLTRTVQKDFHTSMSLPMPEVRKAFWRL
ncbi:MAG: DUF1997 domain-containing protein [Cyanobacteria bacterium J06632_22]